MGLQEALVATASYPGAETFTNLSAHLPEQWIKEALAATGVATVRRRRLPADQVIWLVLGIALYRDESIEEVVDRLHIALPSPTGVVAKSAIPPARARLGEEPMKWLFEYSGAKWAHESADRHRWRGLAVYGIDGSLLRVADTEANRQEFGGWVGYKGDSSNPLVRLVVLMSLRSHLLAAASFGSYGRTSELSHAVELVDELPAESLVIVDALFLSAAFLLSIEQRGDGRHWMTRAKSNTHMTTLVQYSPTDALVEMKVSDEARKQDRSLPTTWRARAVRNHRPGSPPRIILTSLLDPKAYPEEEIRQLYRERWEIELAYDELKTEVLDAEITLRSKSPTAVRQELWGILIGFNLIRLEMERIATEARVSPTRVSFVAALHLIRDRFEWTATTRAPGAVPKHLAKLRDRIKRFILPERRSSRRYPREIKNDYRKYPRRRTNPRG